MSNLDVTHKSKVLNVKVSNNLRGYKGEQGDTGLKGDTGSVGSQGIQGELGIQGEVGLQGDKGATGLKGDTGSVGSQGIQGEQGIQGIQGIQGEIGLTGATGADGTGGGGGGMTLDDGRVIKTRLVVSAPMTKYYENTLHGLVEADIISFTSVIKLYGQVNNQTFTSNGLGGIRSYRNSIAYGYCSLVLNDEADGPFLYQTNAKIYFLITYLA